MWLNDTLHCVQWSLTRCSCSSRQPGGIKNCCSVHACKKAVKDKVRSHMISMTSWQDPQQTITDQSGAIFEPIPTFHYTWRRSLNLEAWLIVSSHVCVAWTLLPRNLCWEQAFAWKSTLQSTCKRDSCCVTRDCRASMHKMHPSRCELLTARS